MTAPTQPDPQLGTRMLAEALDISDPADLLARHAPDSTPGVLAPLVVHTALTLDDLNERLVRAAASAAEDLRRIAHGQDAHLVGSTGILHSDGPQINVLAARRGQEVGHLERLVNAYQHSLASSTDRATAPRRAEELTSQQTARPDQSAARHRTSAPVRVSTAQFTTLEAIARGGVMLRESSVVRGMFVTAPDRVRISRATVDALLGKELADRDTSTSLYQGQRLTLTAQGEAVLAEGRRQTSPRAEAARRRTTTTAVAAPDSGAAAPATAARPHGRAR
ncbi:hypothetical protein ACFXJ5_09040 [Streptomyces sp. NPDC059373]